MLHAVSCLLECLPELSNDNDQPSTSSALLHHDYFNAPTNIDLIAFILKRRHPCI